MDDLRNKSRTSHCNLTVIVPALNEESNLASVLDGLLNVITRSGINAEVLVFNDGSTDRTGELAEHFAKTDNRFRVIHHRSPKGIGASFVEGLREAQGKYITWLPGDGENDPGDLLKYLDLMKHVDIVVPFVINPDVRSRIRRIISFAFRFIINLSFGTSFNYTNGTAIYRTDLLRRVRVRSSGLFCFPEILIKLAKGGALYAEVPILLRGRKSGASTAFSLRSILDILSGYSILLIDIYLFKRMLNKGSRKEDTIAP